MRNFMLFLLLSILSFQCQTSNPQTKEKKTINFTQSAYEEKLYGFWLGQCIANWTGLVTEMDKIGNIGDIKTGNFYTREDWGKPDQPSIWAEEPSEVSSTIDFVFRNPQETWGADDDTDIEYIYQELMMKNDGIPLSGDQIRGGWLEHIKKDEENFLWVSNQKAFDLMQEGIVPPATSDPENNPEFEMIDAQLTTEIFGLYAPGNPEKAVELAHLPIRTTAQKEAAEIAEFYVRMYALSAEIDEAEPIDEQLFKNAERAYSKLDSNQYPAKMYEYVKSNYDEGLPWEACRDSLYERYQVQQADGYDMTSRNIYCNACFAAGINFGASLISLFYGEGDLKETIKIGTLCGWDSDNPTATWGGMLGFIYGKSGIEKTFDREFSNTFNIHRTRINFPNEGIDTFENMARKGRMITENVLRKIPGYKMDSEHNQWVIPINY